MEMEEPLRILEFVRIGNPVADHFIHANTAAVWKWAVIARVFETRRNVPVIEGVLMDDFVESLGGHPWFDERTNHIE